MKLLKLKNLKKQSIFIVMAFAMCVLVGGFAIYSIIFLASKINSSLEVQPPAPSTLKFDIQGFDNLKLIR